MKGNYFQSSINQQFRQEKLDDKYKYTPAEIFRLRMQYKAEFNNLRKTYHEVVIERPTPEKKHFGNRYSVTTLIPEDERSMKK